MKNTTINVTAILITLLLMPMTGCASDGGRDHKRQGPPPQAIEACEGKSVGDSVTFKGRRGEALEATCKEIEGQLAAVPEGMKRGGGEPE